MKKLISTLLTFCLVLSIPIMFMGIAFGVLLVLGDDRADKEEVFEFVREKEDALLAAVASGDFSGFENQGFIKTIDAESSAVDFSCGGAGFGPETSYVGFYYTPDHNMNAVWCAPSSSQSLIPSGNGFEWQDPQGDNWYYVEHISGNFYYYEASF